MSNAWSPRLSLVGAVLAGTTACGWFGPSGPPTAPPDQARSLALDCGVPFQRLSLPEGSRPDHAAAPSRIPLRTWRSRGGTHATPNPIRSRQLYFHRPNGMKVFRSDGTELPHRYFAGRSKTFWSYDADRITVHGVQGQPGPDSFYLVYDRATERENRLQRAHAGLDPDAFACAEVQAGPESRTGLLLPAPAEASWTLTIPPAADLRFWPALVEPEVRDLPRSDGARVTFTWESGGTTTTLWEQTLVDSYGFDAQVRLPLDAWAGQSGTLRVVSDPGQTPRFDYVFLGDPVVASRESDPTRVVLIFVDTLRPDHLSPYGYNRDTSPALARLARGGVVFEEARNVAPWTLPSARSALTGRHPEYYFGTATLSDQLGAAGFATAFFAGNLYLSANFGLNRGWDLHHVELLPQAEDQLDRALAWLERHDDRDTLLLLHLMDPHLPYDEPDDYRRMFAGDAPTALPREKFFRGEVVGARLRTPEDRQYIRDRYDNNIRYADDQLARLYDRLAPDDIVIFFSDHGEEFWDHGGFEHGHTLFDELLRVPLILRAPGIPASRQTAPVSLLDITPTVLDLVGLPVPDGLDGRSLGPLVRGEEGADAVFAARPQAFGRPLYGHERWGVLDGRSKYATDDGRESLFDLDADPGERADLLIADAEAALPARAKLGGALSREVVVALKVTARYARGHNTKDTTATVTVPGGLRAVWVGEDPTRSSMATVQWEAGSDTFVATWPAPFRGSRDVWFVPQQAVSDVSDDVTITLARGEVTATLRPTPGRVAEPRAKGPTELGSAPVGDRSVSYGFGIMPMPDAEAERLSGFDPETAEMLKAMGYAVGDDEGGESPDAEAVVPEADEAPEGDGEP